MCVYVCMCVCVCGGGGGGGGEGGGDEKDGLTIIITISSHYQYCCHQYLSEVITTWSRRRGEVLLQVIQFNFCPSTHLLSLATMTLAG